jgi:hypothetical protein
LYSSSTEVDFVNELPAGKGNDSEDGRGRELAMAKNLDADRNVYYCKSDISLAQKFLAKQRADGIDTNSVVADPLFVDLANADFRLQASSPALTLGFKQIDMTKIGLQA